MLYDVFQFDYLGYRHSIGSVIEAIDHGDYEPLYCHAKGIVEHFAGDWILEDRGTMFEPVVPEKNPSNAEIGYWLLVSLSLFLRRAHPPLTETASIAFGLKMIGWQPDEIDLLIYGESIATLLKPELDGSLAHPLQENDPYWYWVLPTQANRSGWLSLERLQQLKEHLTASETALNAIDPSRLNSPRYSLTRENLQEAYKTTLAMIQSALEAEEGLYAIFS